MFYSIIFLIDVVQNGLDKSKMYIYYHLFLSILANTLYVYKLENRTVRPQDENSENEMEITTF